ncbi:MAG: chemotaxis protein CheW [Syntrophales bacterium]
MKTNGTLPYLIAGVKGLQLAISAEYMQEIIRVPQWHTVPKLPHHVRGVINLRGNVIPLILGIITV